MQRDPSKQNFNELNMRINSFLPKRNNQQYQNLVKRGFLMVKNNGSCNGGNIQHGSPCFWIVLFRIKITFQK